MSNLSNIKQISRALGLACFMAGSVVGTVSFQAVPAYAATQETLTDAIALHDAGRAGDFDATKQAVAALKSLAKTDPANPHVSAYLGSSYAIMARDARSVTDKIRFSNRGLRYLDQAVVMAPDDFVVRLVRASVTASLPPMFGRTESAVEDMMVLDRIFTQAQAPSMAVPMGDIYDHLARLAPEQGDWTSRAAIARSLAAGN